MEEHLHDIYISKYHSKIIPAVDQRLIHHISDNANKKMNKRLNDIKQKIIKLNKSIYKKYQVRGYKEAKIILQFCKENNIDAKLIEDENVKMNKITKIYGSFLSGCCRECDTKPSFENELVSCLYVQIKK